MIEARVKELGIEFPGVPEPKASYIPTVQTGNLVYTSGMSSIQNGKRKYVGKVGDEISLDDAYQSARLAAINCLAAIRKHTGSLDKVKKIVRITGFVRSATNFNQQQKAVNGASDLVGKIFQERGEHARSAIGVNELPFGISVEIEMIVEVEE